MKNARHRVMMEDGQSVVVQVPNNIPSGKTDFEIGQLFNKSVEEGVQFVIETLNNNLGI